MARRTADQTVNREAILLAAADVLHERGYASATMKDIAAAVNLTAGTLYHYFPNKESLVLAVLELGLRAGYARVDAAGRQPGTPAQRLHRMIAAHVTGLTEQPAIGAAMVFELGALASSDSDLARSPDRAHFVALRDSFEKLFVNVVREGIASGDFRPVDTAIFVKTLLGAQNWVGVWYRPEGRLSGAAIAERMADVLVQGVLAAEQPVRVTQGAS